MLRQYGLIRQVRGKADHAMTRVANRFSAIADEDDFTSQLIGCLAAEFDGWSYKGIKWSTIPGRSEAGELGINVSARKLTSRGAHSEESWMGADIVLTTQITIPGYKTIKSMLIQSKNLGEGERLRTSEWNRLLGQIDDMRGISDHSFVWLYSPEGVRSVRASQLSHLETRRPDDLYTSHAASLFAGFIKSEEGDDHLTATDRHSLEELRERIRARKALLLSAQTGGSPWDLR